MCIDEGFLGGKARGPLDQRDLTVEIGLTFRIQRPMGPINRGPPVSRSRICILMSFSGSRVIPRPLL